MTISLRPGADDGGVTTGIGILGDGSSGDPLLVDFTEVAKRKDKVIVINQESDFPVQDATTITLSSGFTFDIGNPFSTAKSFIVESNVGFLASSPFSISVTYTGVGSMFIGGDGNFDFKSLVIDCPNGGTILDWSDTVPKTSIILMTNILILSCGKIASFNDIDSTRIDTTAARDCDQGIEFTGTSILNIVMVASEMISTSATFIGINLNDVLIDRIFSIDACGFSAPTGGIGISVDVAGDDNITPGNLANIASTTFAGDITPLNNIDPDADSRWRFVGNSGIPDTFPDALLRFSGSSTETVISTINTPIKVNAVWTLVRSSLFDTDTTGKITSKTESELKAPVDVSVGLISSGGGSITVTVYVAKNGSIDADSGFPVEISGTTPRTIAIPWQSILSGGTDFLEIFVENNSNTTNIIAENGIFRIR